MKIVVVDGCDYQLINMCVKCVHAWLCLGLV
jgi:hypothetical protein